MYRVLIVDDEPIILKGLRETIEWDSLGMEIAGEAKNGEEALAMAHAHRPHILITDIRMPGMDGIRLIKAIRERGIPIRIIILSGFSDYAFLKEAIRLGVDGYLLKPIDNDEMVSNLNDLANTLDKEMRRSTQLYQGMELLRANTLNRLVTNAIGRSEFEEKASFLELNLTAERYLCAVCGQPGGEPEGDGEPLAACAVQAMSGALAEGAGLTFIDAKNRAVLILFGSEDAAMLAAAQGVLSRVGSQVAAQCGQLPWVGLGSVVRAPEAIWASYAVATAGFEPDRATVEEEPPEGRWSHAVDRAIAHIAAHYAEALSLKQIATLCSISTSYLGQIFKKTTGESFTNYVNAYRIERAKELLAQSNDKVYEVAEKVGFTDYHYFLKIYKKVTGGVPTETRCCNFYHKSKNISH